jgi:predicted transcriptional regulator
MRKISGWGGGANYASKYGIFNRNWVDTQWQQYSSHLQTNSTQNTENGTYTTITKLNTHTNKK